MNILKDSYNIFCSYCGYKVEKNKSKYDLTNYIRDFIEIKDIKISDLPEDYLFLIEKDAIDTKFDDGIDGEYDFTISKDTFEDDGTTRKSYDFGKYVYKREDIRSFGSDEKHVDKVSCGVQIKIPLKISLGKLTAGKEIKKTITVKRCPNCLMELSGELGKHEITNIGFIGSPRSGKTSLIVALCHFIKHNFNSDDFGIKNITIINDVTRNDKNEVIHTGIGKSLNRFLMYYESGLEVDKTRKTDKDIINLNVMIESEKGSTKIINFVDLAGEFWNNPSTPEIDTAEIVEKRPIIGECDKFIICMPDDDIKQSTVNSNYASKILTFFKDIRLAKKIDNCCIINKFDKLKDEFDIEDVFSHISNELVRKAKYINNSGKLLFHNGSYHNLNTSTQEVFRKLAGANNPIGKLNNTFFIPISPYGFNPKENWVLDEKGKERTLDASEIGSGTEHFFKEPEPWHLEILLIWIIHQLGLIEIK